MPSASLKRWVDSSVLLSRTRIGHSCSVRVLIGLTAGANTEYGMHHASCTAVLLLYIRSTYYVTITTFNMYYLGKVLLLLLVVVYY